MAATREGAEEVAVAVAVCRLPSSPRREGEEEEEARREEEGEPAEEAVTSPAPGATRNDAAMSAAQTAARAASTQASGERSGSE